MGGGVYVRGTLAAITAWLAPLPPNDVPKELPSTVSPTVGILSTYATCRGGSAEAAAGVGVGWAYHVHDAGADDHDISEAAAKDGWCEGGDPGAGDPRN